MPYVEEVCWAGRVRETRKYYTARYHRPGIQRQKNFRPTPKEQARVNERHAEMKLRREINENFGPGDLYLTITFKKELRPTIQQIPGILEKYWRALRKLFRADGKELRYIVVAEVGERGAVHFHAIIPKFDVQAVSDSWPYGAVSIKALDSSGQYAQLASYLIKQTSKTFRSGRSPFRRRWNSSRNLKQPKITKRVVGRNSWKKKPMPLKGYYLERDKTVDGEIFGFEYQFYSMVQIPEKQRRRC